MKMMTCKQLGGACNLEFKADTFEEIAELSKNHGMEMFMNKDTAHIEAMNKMRDLMESPDKMKAWFDNKRKAFDAL